MASLRTAERYRDLEGRHAHRRRLRVEPDHRRSATSAGRWWQHGAQSRLGQRHQDRQRQGWIASLLRPGNQARGHGCRQRGQCLRGTDGRMRRESFGWMSSKMGEEIVENSQLPTPNSQIPNPKQHARLGVGNWKLGVDFEIRQRGAIMNRITLAAVCVLLALSQADTYAQGGKPPALATDITAADVQTVIKAP